MKRFTVAVAVVLGVLGAAGAAGGASAPPQGYQSDASFAASYAANGVTDVSATSQQKSCYRPEVAYFDALPATAGYPGGGGSVCSALTTGESQGPYDTQDAQGASNPSMQVKDHSESDIRVDPLNSNHLIGQSKWVVNAEGYNHLLGFYESWDGGKTWPVQGHVPGYEGWTDNTDPVGAFDPWGNFYSLILPYNFYYSKSGTHVYNNGSNQVNPTVPPEAIAVSVRPHGATGANTWITKHNGHPDYVAVAKNANTSDPDKQWITIDTNPSSPHYGRVYVMYTVFVLNPSVIFESHADARPDGTHTDWTTPRVLPTINGKRFDSYLLPHVTPDGTVWTTVTNNPPQQGFGNADVWLIWSRDGGNSWEGPLPVVQGIAVPTYQNTTFREGIVNSFATGYTPSAQGSYPLYVTYEDGATFSHVYLTASYDAGHSWSSPIQVDDGANDASPGEALQPNLEVAPNGTVSVAFYDRRLPCPTGAEAVAAGLQFDPNAPYGAADYCINAAIQRYSPTLVPIGQNVRLTSHTWDPQLNAPHPGCICGSTTFIGDYFGVISAGGWTWTTSVSTFNYAGENPTYYQQQVVSKLPTP